MKSIFFNKKIILISVICILALIAIILSIYFINKLNSTPMVLTSNDNSFKVSIPGKIKFEKKNSATLDIFSKKDEMILSSTVITKERDINLKDIVELEMAGLPSLKTNVDNLSHANKIELKNHEAYKYSYTYYDADYQNDFYAEIIWIKTEKNIYVLDLEVITKNQEKYVPLFNEIINSFEEI